MSPSPRARPDLVRRVRTPAGSNCNIEAATSHARSCAALRAGAARAAAPPQVVAAGGAAAAVLSCAAADRAGGGPKQEHDRAVEGGVEGEAGPQGLQWHG